MAQQTRVKRPDCKTLAEKEASSTCHPQMGCASRWSPKLEQRSQGAWFLQSRVHSARTDAMPISAQSAWTQVEAQKHANHISETRVRVRIPPAVVKECQTQARSRLQTYQGRVVTRGHNVQDDSGFKAALPQQGASASQVAASFSGDTHQTLAANNAASAHAQVLMSKALSNSQLSNNEYVAGMGTGAGRRAGVGHEEVGRRDLRQRQRVTATGTHERGKT